MFAIRPIAATLMLVATGSLAVAQRPQAEIVSVQQDQRAVKDGQEGILITVSARYQNVRDTPVRLMAFFFKDRQPIKSAIASNKAPDGQATAQAGWVPAQNAFQANEVKLFLPFAALDVPRSVRQDLSFQIEAVAIVEGKGTLLASSGPFQFALGGDGGIAQPPASVGNLIGTYAGSETLQGYGDLTMELAANGVAFMTDKDGRREGTWSKDASQVVIKFYAGNCIYRGMPQGNEIVGTAVAGKANWTWRVTRSDLPTPQPQPVAKLFGIWRGTQDRGGPGEPIAVEFKADGAADLLLPDPAGPQRRDATWTIQGNTVVISAFRGTMTYQGVLDGSAIVGKGAAGSEQWNFRIVQEGTRPTPPSPSVDVVGKWRGNEDLQGYGDLLLDIQPNGVAFMTDKDGRREGKWKQEGEETQLAFYSGAVVYRGRLVDGSLSGFATANDKRWNWRATREGNGQVPPTNNPPASDTVLFGRWNGTEDLKGYGDLTMEVTPSGVAYMTDKDGRREGTWKLEGNTIVLVFYNGQVTYRGQIAGTTISGIARNTAGGSWSWTVRRS
jgi:hypothetical protein